MPETTKYQLQLMLNNLSKEGLLLHCPKAKGSQSVSTATKKQLFLRPAAFNFIFCLHCTCFSLQAPCLAEKQWDPVAHLQKYLFHKSDYQRNWNLRWGLGPKNAPRFHRFLDQIKAPCRDHHLKLLNGDSGPVWFSNATTDKHIWILLMVEKSHTSEIWESSKKKRKR